MRLLAVALSVLLAFAAPRATGAWELGDAAEDGTAAWTSTYAIAGEALVPRSMSSISGFQPAMIDSELPTADAADPCPHDALTDATRWEDLAFVADGSELILPVDTTVLVDANGSGLLGTTDSPYGKISVPVGSTLVFADPGAGNEVTLHTLGIDVQGTLRAGSPSCRIVGRLRVVLHGVRGDNTVDATSDFHLAGAAKDDASVKGIVASGASASIFLYGKLYHPTWTRLAAHVPGATESKTAAPSTRNSVLFLQDCVNWPVGGEILVTTSHRKDTRANDFNERATIKGAHCVLVDGASYGRVELTTPLAYYHHAASREYQCEVALLTRTIVVSGNAKSEPTDDTPLQCDPDVASDPDRQGSVWSGLALAPDLAPCAETFLTGLGGHVMVRDAAVGRFSGVEFYRMGMTNVEGRYPLHFHYLGEDGQSSYATDCAVHHSFYRAFVIHNTFGLNVARNVAFDITGHAYYLESGVEERNRLYYNLAAFVHTINSPYILQTNAEAVSSSTSCLVPADRTASGFYISNAYNEIVGNAASGGFAGLQLAVLPEPISPDLRFNGVVPKDRPALLISGNSVHSSSWWGMTLGGVYSGGVLYYEASDTASDTLKYIAGRQTINHDCKDDSGQEVALTVQNTTAWLVGLGANGWDPRSEWLGFEVHDFQSRAIFVLFDVWFDNVVMNCRTSNALLTPTPPGRSWWKDLGSPEFDGFFLYDHLMRHIVTNWKITNCGGEARGMTPWVSGGVAADANGDGGLFAFPLSGFQPEAQLISSGIEYNDADGGADLLKQRFFINGAGTGSSNKYAQYLFNWIDADGSMTLRNTATILGAFRAGGWWRLDDREGRCESHPEWGYNMWTCDQEGGRELAAVALKHLDDKDHTTNQGSIRSGTVTHFGRTWDEATCTPPRDCVETMPRAQEPDITGPYNHAERGGWYVTFDGGTPVQIRVTRVQIEPNAVLVMATSMPAGTTEADLNVYAQSMGQFNHAYTAATSLAEIREVSAVDMYFLDTSTSTLYWRAMNGVVDSAGALTWSTKNPAWSRGGLTLYDQRSSEMTLFLEISCAADAENDKYCQTKPTIAVPLLGCPEGQVAVAIDTCGLPSELATTTTTTTTVAPTDASTCSDTPDWGNGASFQNGGVGFTCAEYETRKWCVEGAAAAGKEWSVSPQHNSPDANCCVCGKPAGAAVTAAELTPEAVTSGYEDEMPSTVLSSVTTVQVSRATARSSDVQDSICDGVAGSLPSGVSEIACDFSAAGSNRRRLTEDDDATAVAWNATYANETAAAEGMLQFAVADNFGERLRTRLNDNPAFLSRNIQLGQPPSTPMPTQRPPPCEVSAAQLGEGAECTSSCAVEFDLCWTVNCRRDSDGQAAYTRCRDALERAFVPCRMTSAGCERSCSSTQAMAAKTTEVCPVSSLALPMPSCTTIGKTSLCCGDGVCGGPETASICPADCSSSEEGGASSSGGGGGLVRGGRLRPDQTLPSWPRPD